jgi:8-oxo-dGTP diphosphatase
MEKFLQIGVKALIFNNETEVLLIKRTERSAAHLKDLWDIPGGRIEIGEEPEDGLLREVHEEVGGIKFKVIRPVQVRSVVNNAERQIVRITYLSKYVGGKVRLSNEHSNFGWFEKEKLPNNIDDLVVKSIKEMDG